MTPKSEWLSPETYEYLLAHSAPVSELQQELIAETHEKLGQQAGMQISADQGTFLTLLTRVLGVRKAVEVGTFTGYSSLCIALGMPDDGQLICHDINDDWTSIARRYWDRAGVSDKIELRLGPAVDTLTQLPDAAELDLVFIDADKPGYIDYWEQLVPRVRTNGVILVDNVLFHGQVVDPAATGTNPVAIRAFNDHAAADERVEIAMLPIADGITFARKK